MLTIREIILSLKNELPPEVKLIAVSKTKPAALLLEAYEAGQRVFGENYVQELTEKFDLLPKDIEWHMIGHLQSNKVKYIAPFVTWIHGVDSEKLLIEINKQAVKSNRIIQVLLQVHIASEETKFGFDEIELLDLLLRVDPSKLTHVRIRGLMGMASFSDNSAQVREEFKNLKLIHTKIKNSAFQEKAEFDQLSMGMSGDWKMAVEEGSTMVRIGSAIFGSRS